MRSRLDLASLAGARALVETGADDMDAIAALLGARGVHVERAGAHTFATAARGCACAFVDVWTAETAPHVVAARTAGLPIWSSGEVALALAPGHTIGITGTAGKTTASRLAEAMFRAAGRDLLVARSGRADNAWPNGELLAALAAGPPPMPLLVELTSSHLAFMGRSPDIAVVVTFWPDHLELHGSLARYRRAKQTIVRHQGPYGVAILNADDAGSLTFAARTPAVQLRFSTGAGVERGVCVAAGSIVVRDAEGERALLDRDATRLAGPYLSDALAAATAAAAAGVPDAAIAEVLAHGTAPRWRLQALGRVEGIQVYSDAMAATPAKASAALAALGGERLVLIAGGRTRLPSGDVHASRAERDLLAAACEEAAHRALCVVVFGEARGLLERALGAADARCVRAAGSVEEAWREALEVARAEQAACILFAPMFPLSIEERERFDELVRG